jgi:hypothetical protein
VSCQKKEYQDKKTGEKNIYFKVYVVDNLGGVGFLYNKKEIRPNTKVKLNLLAGADGRLKAVIAD